MVEKDLRGQGVSDTFIKVDKNISYNPTQGLNATMEVSHCVDPNFPNLHENYTAAYSGFSLLRTCLGSKVSEDSWRNTNEAAGTIGSCKVFFLNREVTLPVEGFAGTYRIDKDTHRVILGVTIPSKNGTIPANILVASESGRIVSPLLEVLRAENPSLFSNMQKEAAEAFGSLSALTALDLCSKISSCADSTEYAVLKNQIPHDFSSYERLDNGTLLGFSKELLKGTEFKIESRLVGRSRVGFSQQALDRDQNWGYVGGDGDYESVLLVRDSVTGEFLQSDLLDKEQVSNLRVHLLNKSKDASSDLVDITLEGFSSYLGNLLSLRQPKVDREAFLWFGTEAPIEQDLDRATISYLYNMVQATNAGKGSVTTIAS